MASELKEEEESMVEDQAAAAATWLSGGEMSGSPFILMTGSIVPVMVAAVVIVR